MHNEMIANNAIGRYARITDPKITFKQVNMIQQVIRIATVVTFSPADNCFLSSIYFILLEFKIKLDKD